jgi:hypothetical protein
VPLRTSLYTAAVLIVVVVLATPRPGHGASDSDGHLYFLAGSFSSNARQGYYPVTLYRAGANRNLVPVRTLVQASEGAASILRDAQGTTYIAYPHEMPTSLSILHAASPQAPDDVAIQNKGQLVLTDVSAISDANEETSYYLVPVSEGATLRSDLPLVSVRGRRGGESPRITKNEWFRYQHVYVEGQIGGPESSPQLTGWIQGSRMVLRVGPTQVVLSDTLPQHSASWDGKQASIVAVNERYFIFSLTRTRDQTQTGNLAPLLVYVYDRVLRQWRSLSMLSASPSIRISGSWLCSISASSRPGNSDNPGRENERATQTSLLPSVKEDYALFQGSRYRIPGVLSLDNLEDGRRIVLNTGQEDSEILAVLNGGDVFYRVNESVFRRTIVGGSLGEPVLILKGDDVPEIHWVVLGR